MNRRQRRHAAKMLKREHRDLHRMADLGPKVKCIWCRDVWRENYVEGIRREFIDAKWMTDRELEHYAASSGDLGVLWEA